MSIIYKEKLEDKFTDKEKLAFDKLIRKYGECKVWRPNYSVHSQPKIGWSPQ